MSFNEFIANAIRTESVIDEVMIDRDMYIPLVESLLRLADNLDLVKKNVFYGKPIDQERFFKNINKVSANISVHLSPEMLFDNSPIPPESMKVNPRVFHAAIGMVTEAAELIELVDLHEEFPDRIKVADEMGDYNWYSAIMCDVMDLNMETEVLAGVIAKLQERFPDKFEAALAITKNKDVELQATASHLNK